MGRCPPSADGPPAASRLARCPIDPGRKTVRSLLTQVALQSKTVIAWRPNATGSPFGPHNTSDWLV